MRKLKKRLCSIAEYRDYRSQTINWNNDLGLDLIVYYDHPEYVDFECFDSTDLTIKGIEVAHSGRRLKYMTQKNYDHLLYLINDQLDWGELESLISDLNYEKEKGLWCV